MRKRGYKADGLELSIEKCRLAKKVFGIDLFQSNVLTDACLPQLASRYDVATALCILEHINEPVLFLKNLRQFLKSEGTVLIQVPNFNDWNKKVNQAYEKFSYVRAHVSYFTPATLKLALEKAGYKNIHIFGSQTYSFENALYWARNFKPFMEYHQLRAPQELEWLDAYYKQHLESRLESCGLTATAQCATNTALKEIQ